MRDDPVTRIVAQLAVAEPAFPASPSKLTVHPLTVEDRTDRSSSLGLTLVNETSCYLQSMVFREFVDPVSQTHPGLRSRWPRANAGWSSCGFRPTGGDPGTAQEVREIPRKLVSGRPPQRRTRLQPASPSPAQMTLIAEPAFAGVGQGQESPEKAGIKMSVERAEQHRTVPRPERLAERRLKPCREPQRLAAPGRFRGWRRDSRSRRPGSGPGPGRQAVELGGELGVGERVLVVAGREGDLRDERGAVVERHRDPVGDAGGIAGGERGSSMTRGPRHEVEQGGVGQPLGVNWSAETSPSTRATAVQ